jgi:hypothetical protein
VESGAVAKSTTRRIGPNILLTHEEDVDTVSFGEDCLESWAVICFDVGGVGFGLGLWF